MGQTSSIAKGWSKYLFGSISEIEKKRAKICKECPSAVVGTYERLMPDFSLKEIQDLKCNECGCPLSTLLRQSEKKCPQKKW